MENKTKARELGITKFPYREYDNRGNLLYIEDKNGYWFKKQYDDNDNQIYFESYTGEIQDDRQKTTTMKFELSDKEQKEINEWQEAIKTIYGKYGSYTYSFTPTGIGSIVEVYSELANIKKDFTHEEEW